MLPLSAEIHVWLALFFVGGAILLYALELAPIALTSLIILGVLLAFYSLFPVASDAGFQITLEDLLRGFGNPALIAVLALLIVSQGLNQTGALETMAQKAIDLSPHNVTLNIAIILLFVVILSGFLNNTPVVLLFIPIMQQLAERFKTSTSYVMMPLSFAAILGGMTTLIGSSTNLLVSSSLVNLGFEPLHFFDFTRPGILLALTGIVYILIASPYLLTPRDPYSFNLFKSDKKSQRFLAEITVQPSSKLVGAEIIDNKFPNIKNIHIHMIQRGEQAFTIPMQNMTLREGDIIVVFATKQALADIIAQGAGVIGDDDLTHPKATLGTDETHALTEVMVTPTSRLVGQTLERIAFRYQYNAIVLGLQRRMRLIHTRLTAVNLEAGDILLLRGRPEKLRELRNNRDLLPFEWTQTPMPSPVLAWRAGLIFIGTIFLAASEFVPVVVAAIAGAAMMLSSGVLNMRQAVRAIDPNLFLLIGSSFALGVILQKTNAAYLLADALTPLASLIGTIGLLSVFFLMVALFTNIISNNACAVIFTPIAVSLATQVGIDPMIFAITVIFAANCCFLTPIGYQTNILVMGAGHYRFNDFTHFGAPLTMLLWLVFTLYLALSYDF